MLKVVFNTLHCQQDSQEAPKEIRMINFDENESMINLKLRILRAFQLIADSTVDNADIYELSYLDAAGDRVTLSSPEEIRFHLRTRPSSLEPGIASIFVLQISLASPASSLRCDHCGSPITPQFLRQSLLKNNGERGPLKLPATIKNFVNSCRVYLGDLTALPVSVSASNSNTLTNMHNIASSSGGDQPPLQSNRADKVVAPPHPLRVLKVFNELKEMGFDRIALNDRVEGEEVEREINEGDELEMEIERNDARLIQLIKQYNCNIDKIVAKICGEEVPLTDQEDRDESDDATSNSTQNTTRNSTATQRNEECSIIDFD